MHCYWKSAFWLWTRKGQIDYIKVWISIVHKAANQLNWKGSHLCAIFVSYNLWSVIGQPNDLHFNMCRNAKNAYQRKTSMKNGVMFCLNHFSVSQRWHSFISDFLNQYDVFMTFWASKNMNISKTAVLLANEHQSVQKKCYKRFLHTFLLCNRSLKTTMWTECKRKWHQWSFNQNDGLFN